MSTAGRRRVSVMECPGGPLLVRGADEIVGADGSVAPAERSVVALCRCGRSDRLPFCDDSHKDRSRRKRGTKNEERPSD